MTATQTQPPAPPPPPGQTFDERREELLAAGYRRGAPGPAALRADAGACAEMACHNCTRVGLLPRTFTRPRPASYRVLALCPACGAWEEFQPPRGRRPPCAPPTCSPSASA